MNMEVRMLLGYGIQQQEIESSLKVLDMESNQTKLGKQSTMCVDFVKRTEFTQPVLGRSTSMKIWAAKGYSHFGVQLKI